MIAHIFYTLIVLAIGFGLGRIKNATKLAAISTVITNAEKAAVTDAKTVIADVKAKL